MYYPQYEFGTTGRIVDWRNGVLITCFVIFTPYAWEYLAAFFAGVIPVSLVSDAVFSSQGEWISARLVLESMVYSLFACLLIAVPLGVLTNKAHRRNAVIYAGLSTLHLIVVFLYERISATTFYLPQTMVEAITFFFWLSLAMLAGGMIRKSYARVSGK